MEISSLFFWPPVRVAPGAVTVAQLELTLSSSIQLTQAFPMAVEGWQ